MQILICTGNGGQGSAMVAAATASMLAQSGKKTLLTSIGPSHGLGVLLDTELTNTTITMTPHLDAWVLDAPATLRTFVEQIRPKLFGSIAGLSGDELPLIPGIDVFLCLERLRQSAASGYDMVVIDAGHHDNLLRVLALPDSFRWFVRLTLGLDRGPGQSNTSLNRALLPTSLLPFEWVGQVQDARVQFEHARDTYTAATRTSVRYVLRPDAAALGEARLAVPALHLHGLAVDSLIVGPLLPADVADDRLAAVVAQQQVVTAEAERIWHTYSVLRLPLSIESGGVVAMAALGQALYSGYNPQQVAPCAAPIVYGGSDDPFIAVNLPGMPRGALNLTLSNDELIIQVGAYRRHLLLPAALRGRSNIKASREGEQLFVRLRQ